MPDAATSMANAKLEWTPEKENGFLHDFTQTWLTHLCAASHDAINSSGGTYFRAECSLFPVVVSERLCYDGLDLLVVG